VVFVNFLTNRIQPESTAAAPVPKTSVLAQLGRILRAPRFIASPRLIALLDFLVQEVLAGRGDSLIQYRIATEGLGLGDRFDPDNKTLVRSHATRLRKELDRYYETLGGEDPVVISLPASGYQVTFSEKSRLPIGGGAVQQGQNSAPVLALLEFKGIGLVGAWRFLPVWLVEELSLILCQSSHLRMLGPFSRQWLVRDGIEAAELSQRHPADFILDGGIEQRGELIIIRTRLLEASGLQIWSRRDECPLAEWDPARFEREIVQAIAVELGTDFGKIDRHLIGLTALNPDAVLTIHEAVLRGKAFESDRSESCYAEGVAALQNALRIAPANPLLHATLGVLMLAGHAEYFTRKAPFPTAALEHLARARSVDPTNRWARVGQVFAQILQGQYSGFAESSAALLADPGFPQGLAGSVALWQIYTRTDTPRSSETIHQLQLQNPHYSRMLHTGFALRHYAAGEMAAALHELDQFDARDDWFDPVLRTAIHLANGQRDDARRERARLLEMCPDFDEYGGVVLARMIHPEWVARLMAAQAAAV
jgi:TolB-like protein